MIFLLVVSTHTQKQLAKWLAFTAHSFRNIYQGCYIAGVGNLCAFLKIFKTHLFVKSFEVDLHNFNKSFTEKSLCVILNMAD